MSHSLQVLLERCLLLLALPQLRDDLLVLQLELLGQLSLLQQVLLPQLVHPELIPLCLQLNLLHGQ